MIRRVKEIIYCIFLSVLFNIPVSAEESGIGEDFKFYHLGTKDGLSQSRVSKIYEDNQGYMWFGTQSGLNRWDGYNFRNYYSEPGDSSSLSHNQITDIYQDIHNNFWVGTTEGLNLYLDKKGAFVRISLSGNIRSDQIFRIIEDKSRNLWIASNQGLYKINHSDNFNIENGDQLPLFEKVLNKPFRHLHNLDSSSLILSGIENNLIVFNHRSGDTTNISFPLEINLDPSKFYNQNITTDSKGRIWIGIFNVGIFRLMPESLELVKVDLPIPGLVNDIMEYKDGVFLITTDSDGLYIFNENTGSLKNIRNEQDSPNSLSSNKLLRLFKSSTGQLWISSSIAEINIFSPTRTKFQIYDAGGPLNQGLSHESVLCFLEDSLGKIWIGTELGGLNLFDPETNSFQYFLTEKTEGKGMNSETVLSLFEDSKKRLWIGTWENGLKLLNREEGVFKNFFNREENKNNRKYSIWAIQEDSVGNLWLGTHNGLIYFNPDNKKFRHFQYDPEDEGSISNNSVFSIIRSKENEIYIGTAGGGLNLYDYNTEKFIKIYEKSNESGFVRHTHIYHIYEDNNGWLWLSTEYGISIYKPQEKTFEYYTNKDGLPHNTIRGIIQDNAGSYWITTLNGVSKFDYQEKTFHNYTSSDGLQAGEFKIGSVLATSKNLLYFGGNEGFNTANPNLITENTIIPKIVFTGLKINDQAIGIGDTINNQIYLKANLNDIKELNFKYERMLFSIQFAALHYAAPENNQYAYKLDGYLDQWIYTDADNREADFINLKPGHYIFRVKASNSDGYWNEEGVSLNINVLAPWYLSWWAISLYVLIIVLLLYTSRRIIMLNLNYQHSLNIERLKNSQMEEIYTRDKEINNLKMLMLTNVSHEFRTPLTLIIGPLESLIDKIKERDIREELKIIRKNAQRLLILINQMLDIRKIEMGKYKVIMQKDDLIQRIREIYDSFSLLAKKKNLKFEFITDSEGFITYFDNDIVEKTLYNLLSNAFKYSPVNGSVWLEIKTNVDEYLKIIVTDTGTGIPEEEKEFIFERFYRTRKDKLKNTEGSGVGLSLTRDLVQLYGGEINVQSKHGSGARFIVKLPVYNNVPEQFERTDPKISSKKETGIMTSDNINAIEIEYTEKPDNLIVESQIDETKQTLLIVEDNSGMRDYIAKNLIDNFNVIQAENGQVGYEKSELYNPDIIITDIMMPVMDGIEFCKKIKADIRFNHIPVILLSAKLSDEDKIFGFEAGADDYINKPFNPKILKAKVDSMIKNRETLRNKYSNDLLTGSFKIEADNTDKEFLGKAVKIVEKNINKENFGVDEFAKEIGMGRTTFYKKIKALTGYTVNDFIKMIRLKKAEHLLKNTKKSISEIYYEVGFSDGSYFASCFQKQYSMLPSEYREMLEE